MKNYKHTYCISIPCFFTELFITSLPSIVTLDIALSISDNAKMGSMVGMVLVAFTAFVATGVLFAILVTALINCFKEVSVFLDESTIEANSRFFASKDDVPKTALTMGIGAIMNAKKVLLVANGKGKKEIVEKAFFGEITPRVPASILQLHPDLTVIYTEE